MIRHTDFRVSYDDIALNMGNPTKRTFEQTHEDMVKGLTRTLVYYVKSLQQNDELNVAQTATESGTRQAASGSALKLGTDPNGYPILPAEACEGNLTKRQLEAVLRTYLSQHYCKFTWIYLP